MSETNCRSHECRGLVNQLRAEIELLRGLRDDERAAREAAEARAARLVHLLRVADEYVRVGEGVGITYYTEYMPEIAAEHAELRRLVGGSTEVGE